MFKWIGLLVMLAQVLLCLMFVLKAYVPFILNTHVDEIDGSFSSNSQKMVLELCDKVNNLQGFSILLAAALRSIGPNQESICDSDEEYASARLPLMNHIVQPPEYIVAAKNSSNWNVRIHS